MESFRPGVMGWLGPGYTTLSVVNFRLVYCAISGAGQTAQYRDEARYNLKIKVLSGIMPLTGHEEMGPTRGAGFAVCDVLCGTTAAFAASSAFFQRARTGPGQFSEVPMPEASLAFLSTEVADFTVADPWQERSANQVISRKVATNRFRANDRFRCWGANHRRYYDAPMRTIGRTEVLGDPRFVD